MSRIEEALRRAAIAATPAGTVLYEPVSASADRTTLARFPVEDQAERQVETIPDAPQPKSIAAPRFGVSGHLAPLGEEFAGKLILNEAAPVAVEQYRRLAGVLHEAQMRHNTRTLMVASALPREGKTLTVTNLALTLSEAYGRRVLLIDADLRRPSVHEIFRLPNTRGLGDGLRSKTGEFSLLEVSPRLTVLPAGRAQSNPMAGLISERMRTLLAESAKAFEWVLLDAPPVGIMPDANLLARLTDGVIFVIAAGSTPYQLVDRAVAELGRDQIIGTVLNRVDSNSMPATGYYDVYYGANSGR